MRRTAFASRQRGAILVLAAISDAQALEASLMDTDVMDVPGDTRPFPAADITVCLHMPTCNVHGASFRQRLARIPR
jgi:hypothetical protein